jgi:phospholipid-binding lipoprotein MlaA
MARRGAMIPYTRRALAGPIAALLLTAGCAQIQPGQDRLAERDPLEKVNRKIWNVDMFADRHVLKPIAKGYRAVAPRPVRQGFSNFFANLTEPWSLVNNVLQGHAKRAGRNLKRFLVNTTIGIGGFLDHASKIGISPANEDFGQTLARYGVNGGPYVVLPLLGPSTMRDAVGSGVAYLADPLSLGMRAIDGHIWAKRGFTVARLISARSDLIDSGGDAFLESSLDPYAAARSAYLQHRRAEILNEEEGTGPGNDPASPPGETVPTPIGDVATTPNKPVDGGALPDSAAPLPGDDAAPSAASPPASAAPLPESAAPLPGDEPAPAAPPRS